jgi:hypothetical protein
MTVCGQFRSLLAVVALLVVNCLGCGNPATTVVRVSPEEFATGDLKRLASHLELSTGRVKLERSGPPMACEVSLEIRKNGKLDRKLGGSSNGSIPNDISLSLQPVPGPNGTEKYRVVVVETTERRSTRWYFDVFPVTSTSTGQVSFASTVEPPQFSQKDRGHLMPTLGKAADLTAEHPVTIWCYAGGRGAETSKGGETIDDVIARVEWALVAKLRLQNPP